MLAPSPPKRAQGQSPKRRNFKRANEGFKLYGRRGGFPRWRVGLVFSTLAADYIIPRSSFILLTFRFLVRTVGNARQLELVERLRAAGHVGGGVHRAAHDGRPQSRRSPTVGDDGHRSGSHQQSPRLSGAYRRRQGNRRHCSTANRKSPLLSRRRSPKKHRPRLRSKSNAKIFARNTSPGSFAA